MITLDQIAQRRAAGRVRSPQKKRAAAVRITNRYSVASLITLLKKDPSAAGHPGLWPALIELGRLIHRIETARVTAQRLRLDDDHPAASVAPHVFTARKGK